MLLHVLLFHLIIKYCIKQILWAVNVTTVAAMAYLFLSILNIWKRKLPAVLQRTLLWTKNFIVLFYQRMIFENLGNTADPDQTAQVGQSDQGLPCLHIRSVWTFWENKDKSKFLSITENHWKSAAVASPHSTASKAKYR